MSTITFVAIRSLVSTGVAVTAQDILADDLSNEFQSTTTDLSGFTQGNYIFVHGFTTYANPELVNGWHYVPAPAGANSLPTNSDLPDVAAGDQISITEYEYGYGSRQVLNVDLTEYTPSRKVMVEKATSYGGLRQGLLYRVDRGYDIEVIVSDDDKKYWDCFFDSVSAMEPFVLDANGTPETVVLDGDERYTRIGNFKVVRMWRIAFKVIRL